MRKNPNIPFSQPNEPVEIPFSPIVEVPQDETHGTFRISRRTQEEIENIKGNKHKR